jgi:hypothetical protein
MLSKTVQRTGWPNTISINSWGTKKHLKEDCSNNFFPDLASCPRVSLCSSSKLVSDLWRVYTLAPAATQFFSTITADCRLAHFLSSIVRWLRNGRSPCVATQPVKTRCDNLYKLNALFTTTGSKAVLHYLEPSVQFVAGTLFVGWARSEGEGRHKNSLLSNKLSRVFNLHSACKLFEHHRSLILSSSSLRIRILNACAGLKIFFLASIQYSS